MKKLKRFDLISFCNCAFALEYKSEVGAEFVYPRWIFFIFSLVSSCSNWRLPNFPPRVFLVCVFLIINNFYRSKYAINFFQIRPQFKISWTAIFRVAVTLLISRHARMIAEMLFIALPRISRSSHIAPSLLLRRLLTIYVTSCENKLWTRIVNWTRFENRIVTRWLNQQTHHQIKTLLLSPPILIQLQVAKLKVKHL